MIREFKQGMIIDLDKEELVLEDKNGNPVNCKNMKIIDEEKIKENWIIRKSLFTDNQIKELPYVLYVRTLDKSE